MTTQHATAIAAAGTTTTTTKTGCGSFPVYTQRMILHTSSRPDSDDVRQAPLDSLAKIFAFPNAAFVGRHVHNLLRDKANHDMLIPTGLCTAIRVGAFTSNKLSERPGLFSLFSCFRQPADAGDSQQADVMHMQLKMQESTTGLDNKDLDKLIKTYHVAPLDFVELHLLLKNFRGIVLFAFGANSAIAMALKICVHFFARGDLAAQFRSMANEDSTLASKVGWFIKCRIQSHLLACGAATDPAQIPSLLFDGLISALEEQHEDYGLQLCNFLRNKLPTTQSTLDDRLLLRVARGGAQNPQDKGGAPHQVAVNSHRFLTNVKTDVWATFVANLLSCPIPDTCCRFHLRNSKCNEGAITDPVKQKAVLAWAEECRSKMPAGKHKGRPRGDDSADSPPTKKIKPSTNSGSYSPLPSCRLSAGDKLFAKPTQLRIDIPIMDCRQPSNTIQPPGSSPRSIAGTSPTVPPPTTQGLPSAATPSPLFADGGSSTPSAAETCPVTFADGGSNTSGVAETCPVILRSPPSLPLPPASPFLPSIPALVLSDLQVGNTALGVHINALLDIVWRDHKVIAWSSAKKLRDARPSQGRSSRTFKDLQPKFFHGTSLRQKI